MQLTEAVNNISENAMSNSNKPIKFVHLQNYSVNQCCIAHM